MAEWRVAIETVRIFPHPNAEALQLAKVGQHQLVIRKESLQDGDQVVFVPQRSVLPDALAEPFRNYLKGKERNRVGSVRLRGELSMGVTLSIEEASACAGEPLPEGECIAQLLGIEKYEAPIPLSLAGEVEAATLDLSKHDVEQFGIYSDQFAPDEAIIVTEKIHGSQVMYFLGTEGEFGLTSKGLGSRHLIIKESNANTYWQADKNAGIQQRMQAAYADLCPEGGILQFFGEAVPVQGSKWSYGFHKPTVLIFDVRVDGMSVPLDSVPQVADIHVPVIYTGEFQDANFAELCAGNECVSGDSLHIREGVVVRPSIDRYASDGTRLMVKVINPKYAKKETGDEIS